MTWPRLSAALLSIGLNTPWRNRLMPRKFEKQSRGSRVAAMNDKQSFTGKVAFVTGAANGIGRAAALSFAQNGASVLVADVSEQGNHETSRMIEELGARALAVRCD